MADFQRSLFSSSMSGGGNNYNEIFGSFFASASASIPVLDFSFPAESQHSSDAPCANFDYSEIFGGYDAGDFGLSYEEVFAERRGSGGLATSCGSHSESQRGGQCADISSASMEGGEHDLFANLKMQVLSVGTSKDIYDCTVELNVPSSKSQLRSKGDSLSGISHVTHLNEASGSTVVVASAIATMEESPSTEIMSLGTGDNSITKRFVDGIESDERKLGSTSNPKNELRRSHHRDGNFLYNQILWDRMASTKQTPLQSTNSEGGPPSNQHHLCNPAEQRLPRKNGTSAHEVFLTVFDINLQTQSSDLPPPSRAPPNPGSSKWVKDYQDELLSFKPSMAVRTCNLGSVIESPSQEEPVKYDSLAFMDAEMDAVSSTCASADAMNEVKGNTEVKLTKVSIERNSDGDLDVYSGHIERHLKQNEKMKENRDKSALENLDIKAEGTLDACSGGNIEMKGSVVDEEWNLTFPVHTTPNFREKTRCVEVTKEHPGKWQEKDTKSVMINKPDETSSEWKVEKQFYELVNDEKYFKPSLEMENDKNKPKATEGAYTIDQSTKKAAVVEHIDKLNSARGTLKAEDNIQKSKPACGLHSLEAIEKRWKLTPKAQMKEEKEKRSNIRQEGFGRGKDVKNKVGGVTCMHNEDQKGPKAAYRNEEGDKLQLASECEEEKRFKVTGAYEEKEKSPDAALECNLEKKILEAAREHGEEMKRKQAIDEQVEQQKKPKSAPKQDVEEKILTTCCEYQDEERRLDTGYECGKAEKTAKFACECKWEENNLTADNTQDEEREKLIKDLEGDEEGKKLKAGHDREVAENWLKAAHKSGQVMGRTKAANESEQQHRLNTAYEYEQEKRQKLEQGENKPTLGNHVSNGEFLFKETQVVDLLFGQTKKLNVPAEAYEHEEDQNEKEAVRQLQESDIYEHEEDQNAKEAVRQLQESDRFERIAQIADAPDVSVKQFKMDRGEGNEKLKQVHSTDESGVNRKVFQSPQCSPGKQDQQRVKEAKISGEQDENARIFKQKNTYQTTPGTQKEVSVAEEVSVNADVEGLKAADRHKDGERHQKATQVVIELEKNENLNMIPDKEETNQRSTPIRRVLKRPESGIREAFQVDSLSKGEDNLLKIAPQMNVGWEKPTDQVHAKLEGQKRVRMQRERKLDIERLRKVEEDQEREREREKDRIAVERVTRETHDSVFAEGRERAQRVSMYTSQRAFIETRGRAEIASVETARLRAERAHVERPIAEPWVHAPKKAMAEKAASREREDASLRQNQISDSQGSSGKEGESAVRLKARLERHQRTAERAAKALEEKNLRDIQAEREKEETNRLAEILDADIRRWSNGKEGNLRALLSTFQYILGPESGWQPVPLTDIITAVAVKKAFRKAALCVHPDKVQQRGACIQQKYICERVFDLLKEAWNKFSSEEP